VKLKRRLATVVIIEATERCHERRREEGGGGGGGGGGEVRRDLYSKKTQEPQDDINTHKHNSNTSLNTTQQTAAHTEPPAPCPPAHKVAAAM